MCADTLTTRQRQVTTSSWHATVGGVEVRFGSGCRDQLGEALRLLGVSRPLLVTDPGVRATGHIGELAEAGRAANCVPAIFDRVDENPTTEHVDDGVDAARTHDADCIVGIGGGSAMDAAKAINFIVSRGGRMEDHEGWSQDRQPMLPSIGIPTTAGTGSEAQSYALIATAGEHRKMACGAHGVRFRTALLDPDFLTTVPRGVRVATGIDAVAHAVESHVSTAATRLSRLYSVQAWRLLSVSLPVYLASSADAQVRESMLLGAHLSGAAIETSMLGAAHACANPLTAHYGLTHGIAVGLMLPHVVRYNESVAGQRYAELLDAGVGDVVVGLLEQASIATRLRDHGVEQERLPILAREAASQWTAQFNPRPVAEADLMGMYESAY